jgi:hypothetical protein
LNIAKQSYSPPFFDKNRQNENFFLKSLAQVCVTHYLCTRKSGTAPLRRPEKRMFFEFLEETKDEKLLICGKSAKLIFQQTKDENF